VCERERGGAKKSETKERAAKRVRGSLVTERFERGGGGTKGIRLPQGRKSIDLAS